MLLINQVYLGDCLEVMRQIDDKSIDMILCDLPYGMTACKWDSVIPMDQLWIQYKRIIKKHGAIVLTASQPFTSKLIMSNPSWFRCEWIWEKNNGSNFMLYNFHPQKIHENIIIFGNCRVNYYPQKTQGEPYISVRNGALINEHYHEGTSRTNTFNVSGLRFPKSIIKINSERGLHPTQKPLGLFEYFIKTYSNIGDIILDNAAGSGTTAIAALNTGRNFICIEKEEKYHDICLTRIKDYKKPLIHTKIVDDGYMQLAIV